MKKKVKGFTLIELMIVVAIIGILAAIAIPNFMRYQLRAKFGELKENVSSIFKSEEALRQSERVVGNPAASGVYLAFSDPFPLSCKAGIGSTKKDWVNTDFQRSRLIDWSVEGSTYGCYHIGTTAFTDNTTGTNLSVYSESDIDGDGVNACVVLYKATLDSQGNPTAGLGAACANNANGANTFGAPWGVPRVADDSVF